MNKTKRKKYNIYNKKHNELIMPLSRILIIYNSIISLRKKNILLYIKIKYEIYIKVYFNYDL